MYTVSSNDQDRILETALWGNCLRVALLRKAAIFSHVYLRREKRMNKSPRGSFFKISIDTKIL